DGSVEQRRERSRPGFTSGGEEAGVRAGSSPPAPVMVQPTDGTGRAWGRRTGRWSGTGECARAVDSHAGVGEPVEQVSRGLVIGERERLQVGGAERQHPAVVVTALGLDRTGVAGDVGEVILVVVVQLHQVEDDLAGELVLYRRAL